MIMATKLLASLKTLVKYLFWTAVAAGLTAAANALGGHVPAWAIPAIAAALKSAATFAATQAGG